MSERSPTERGMARKVLDKVGLAFAFISIPFAGVGLVEALAAGNEIMATIFGGSLILDGTQLKQHGRSPEKQSWWNPERIADKVIGSLRFRQAPTQSMARTTV